MTQVEDVRWDLTDLIEPQGGLDAIVAHAQKLTEELCTYEGKVASLSADEFLKLMHKYGELHEYLGRAGNYTGLLFSVNTQDEDVAAEMQKIEEMSAEISAQLSFIDVEFNEMTDEQVAEIVNHPGSEFCRYYLQHLRRSKPYTLSTKEEALMAQMSVTGESAWARLFENLCSVIGVDVNSNGEKVPLEVALSTLHSADRDARRTARDAVSGALTEDIKTYSYIYNTLINDHAIEDKLRGYPTWLSARNLENDATDESVDALVSACKSRYDISHRWYALKAKLLGLDKLEDYDRYAPLSNDETEFSYDQACEIVRDAYNSFSPKMTAIFDEFMKNKWIDAPPREGKRGGAFCAYTVSSHHPYVLLNWTNRRNDVLTLAHELGHACHAYLAREQGTFHQDTGLTFAETASVFAESVTFNRLLETVDDPRTQLELLAEYIDDQMATVFRQIAMHQFETAVHTHRREIGEVKVSEFADYWLNTQRDMLGDAVNVSEGYGNWWSYVTHFIAVPGYVYAYAYGQLLALSVYAKYQSEGDTIVPAYEEMLAAGGSASPQELAQKVGVNLDDPHFWTDGLEIISSMVDRAEALAKQIKG
jgi:oligoendopeptidase F